MTKDHEAIEVVDGVHNYSNEETYIEPKEDILKQQLEWFKDQKLGLMMHWGPYSQLGVVESWALSDEDGDWSREDIDWETDSKTFKQQYVDLNKSFNPVRFQPEQWAELASENGFKYLVFTTKHHDGYAMWDTKTTDYKTTGKDSPFCFHRYADICRHLFDAFRAKGLGISAYFSKADWHVPSYWAPDMEKGEQMWRGPSYNPDEYPELWEEFVQFTHEQMRELLTDYGRIEVLWLDAGWVSTKNNQDIRLGELIEEARERQPWLLSADRTVGGPYENIITPEQMVPKEPIHVPWESCITMGSAFSFRFEDDYKSGRELVHLLIEVVSKGGNLALNVAPQPDGRLPRGAIKGMKELGTWLNEYGEAIYETRPIAPYFQENIAFTKKVDTVYCFYLLKENEAVSTITIPYEEEVHNIEWMHNDTSVPFRKSSLGIEIESPKLESTKDLPYVFVFKLT
ncbi:alpha-L-fucosidase [Alkalicoccobacillus porphyridii]|uniref:alpha-L-fucosidase n=1 Tax=Alkalicoccobacillus porphyridii TaxID=2597270 RepID=A0A553ZX56_9BACI|nr:alpha-L-fucosidase [Alkalicoccobacillus porphyridii]TSB46023.1 alpha-L-fucosidase [Alkalicoccobacillus porphyridii]